MEGDLREFPLAEILQFISLGSRTGVLEILQRDGGYGINFTAGTITGLTTDNWSLAQELRESELLPADVATSLLARGNDTQELRGAVLAGGHMTAEEWTSFVARQVERLLYVLFDAREGRFRFKQGATDGGPWLTVRVTADRAVLEGTRWSETWARTAARIPSRQSRFERVDPPPLVDQHVTAAQWRVWVALSEAGNIRQLAARTVLTEVEVVEAIDALLDAGLVQPEGRGG